MSCCNVCGAENGDQARFCANCGAGMERPNITKTPQFTYVAVDKSHKRVSGMVAAADKRGATIAVERLGLVPVSIAPASSLLSKPTSVAGPAPSADTVIRFACPACLQKLEAEPVMAGDRISCLKCGKRFNIPSAEQAALANIPNAALGAPAGPEGARRFWKRRSVLLALAATLLVVGGLSAFVLPKFLPGAVKNPPLGWVAHNHTKTQSTIYLPSEWKRLTDASRSFTDYGIVFDPEVGVVFVKTAIGSRSVDAYVEVNFFGWQQSGELHAKGDRRFLTDNMPKDAELEKDQVKIISKVIHKLAGGMASEIVIDLAEHYQKKRVVTLVAKNRRGAKQLVTLDCLSYKSDFDEFDAQVFRPMLESFVYGVGCKDEKESTKDRKR